MICDKAAELILSGDGTLRNAGSDLEKHIAQCPECARLMSEWAAIAGSKTRCFASPPAPADFAIMSAARTFAAERHYSAVRSRRIISFACAAACVVFFAMACVFMIKDHFFPDDQDGIDEFSGKFAHFGSSLDLSRSFQLSSAGGYNIENINFSAMELNAEIELIAALMQTYSEDSDLPTFERHISRQIKTINDFCRSAELNLPLSGYKFQNKDNYVPALLASAE